ncbi:hypothetical protein [Agromyces intestinalis]|uniref:hypothetical protein n=1 Tax=Agromyces intestinalis TaxID=2592652 RepID=UPI001AEF82BB|nr:hypothetical protein [Agromyces intestinalis]
MTSPTEDGFARAAAAATTVPMLPCGDVDELVAFWTELGLELTYRQLRPNPYVALRAGAIDLHYYGMPGWDPEASHSTCAIAVPDPRPLHERFREGLRARYGRIPLSGFPRITRPRERANNGGLSGFSLIDPAGNWIRVTRAAESPVRAGDDDTTSWTTTAETPLARAVENAVVVGDSHGDAQQGRKILVGALRRHGDAPPADRARALAYLVELALRLHDTDAAHRALADLEGVPADGDGVVHAALSEARETLAQADPPEDAGSRA